jgi:hypothetical protein
MLFWQRSDVTTARLNGLVAKGLMCPLTAVQEWIVPFSEAEPRPPPGYVVSFVFFHERGFATPAHAFFRGLLHHYQVERQHLNPNGIQNISAFIALCEGFLGVSPVFELWKYFFTVSLVQAKEKGVMVPAPMGCAGIHLRSGDDRRSAQYVDMHLRKSHKGWHAQWFYVKDDERAPLSRFTGRMVTDVPRTWKDGPINKEKDRLAGLLGAIQQLKANGLTGSGIVGAYHARGIAPIMARTLPLYRMALGIDLSGTVLAREAARPSEVQQQLRDAFEGPPALFPDPH